jgi:hypothetical protein
MKINTALMASYTSEMQQHTLDVLVDECEASFTAHTKDLPQFANEFCYAFNLRVAGASGRNIYVNTPNGLPVGKLYIGESGPRYGAKERMFAFKSSLIVQRERALPGTYDKDTRHAKTIRGMLQTVKKNDKPITEDIVAAWYTDGVAAAITTPYDDYRNRSAPTISVPSQYLLPMVEAALGVDTYSVQQHKDILQKAYDKYLADNAGRIAAEATALRYGRGCTVIGQSERNQRFFYVAQAKLIEDTATGKVLLNNYPKVQLTAPLKRVESLPEEVCGLAAITKAYMQGRPEGVSASNPFGISFGTDTYYDDVDVIASNTHRMQWIIIPTENDHG